jgi:hypothetical protein
LPGVTTFFGRGALGEPSVHSWLADAPRLSWSVLRGVGDPLLSFLALFGWIGTSSWIVIDLGTRMLRGNGPRERDPLRYSVPLWCLTGAVVVFGIWSRLATHDELANAWLVPLIPLAAAIVFFALELLRSLMRGEAIQPRMLVLLGGACGCGIVLLALGVYLSLASSLTPGSIGARLLGPWQDDPALLYSAMIAWIVATVCLMLGCCTRAAAVATWVLSLSFANLNDSIDNAGDTIRGIILFYLMLCPCGAVWSIDRLWRRWRGNDASIVYVAPWAIRMLFVQMTLIYFCNGVYKLFGESWREGYSLYYVLGDFTLSRFSMADCPLPLWMLRGMTWSVLAWEITFPLLVVLNRWTRVVALVFGVLFHLGIGVTMELGFFVPYALCLYLPLVPWELVLHHGTHGKKT